LLISSVQSSFLEHFPGRHFGRRIAQYGELESAEDRSQLEAFGADSFYCKEGDRRTGGPDPTALVGYSLPLKDFTFVLRLGGNTDDALKPVYWRTEVLLDYHRAGFDICLGESFAGAIDASRKDNLYSKLTTDYAWEKFKFGVQTDQVWLLEKGEFMYWQVGPAVSVANILLWAGKDFIRENKFFRIALTLKI